MDRLTRLSRLLLFQLSAELDIRLAGAVVKLTGPEDRARRIFGMRLSPEVYQAVRLPDEARPVLEVPAPLLDVADSASDRVRQVVSEILAILASLRDECFRAEPLDLEDLVRRNREADEELCAEIRESLRLRRRLEARRRALLAAFCAGGTHLRAEGDHMPEPLTAQGRQSS